MAEANCSLHHGLNNACFALAEAAYRRPAAGRLPAWQPALPPQKSNPTRTFAASAFAASGLSLSASSNTLHLPP